MALRKTKTYKGQSYEYWGWVEYAQKKVENVTLFAMGAFKDKATREADIANEMTDLREIRQYGGLLTLEQCYERFKASNAHTLVFNDEERDEEGNITKEATTQDVENTNWFADAEDA